LTISQRDLHVSAETAARDRSVQGLGALQQIAEQAFTLGRRCGRGKARTHALLGIGRKGELRDQEQTTADIGQAQIHLTFPIRKYAVAQEPLQEPIGLGFAVTAFDSNEHQEPGGDSADGDTLDLDPCFGNALKKTDHCPVTSCTCMRMASPLS